MIICQFGMESPVEEEKKSSLEGDGNGRRWAG